MVKFVSIFKLVEGADHDKLWDYWITTHAANARKVPGITKYKVNRTTKPTYGEPLYWGIAEIWFESMEAYEKYLTLRPDDPYWLKFYQPVFSTFVEEQEIG